jgi:hypothetical protein
VSGFQISCSGFRVSGFQVQGFEFSDFVFRVSGFRISCSGWFWVFTFGVQDFGFSDFVFRASDFQISCSGSRVCGFRIQAFEFPDLVLVSDFGGSTVRVEGSRRLRRGCLV